jgi:hypothetical protein
MVLYLRLGVALDSVICSITYARLNKMREHVREMLVGRGHAVLPPDDWPDGA